MRNKKAAIIGVGGRTGTMFAFELAKSIDVLGVARKKEVDLVKKKKLYINKGKGSELFEGNLIEDIDFSKSINPDIIFLATKNPISAPLRYYLQRCEKKPVFVISQNGIDAISSAKRTFQEIAGIESEEIRLIRVVLFNPIDREESESRVCVKYSLPIRIALAKTSPGDIKDVVEVFERAGFETKEFPFQEARNLEFSKLFLNLIGMASASKGLSIIKGFKNREVFEEEINVLKEYIKAVKLSGGKFLNFPRLSREIFHCLIRLFTPFSLLPFRSLFAKIISRGRKGKPKDLDEIDYYNGAVINLGKKAGIDTPINNQIYSRVKGK